MKYKLRATYLSVANLLAGANRLLDQALPGSLVQSVDCVDAPYMTFMLNCDVPLRLDIEGGVDNVNFVIYDAITTVPPAIFTVYNFGAPRSDNGVYVLAYPFNRFRITVPGAVGSAVLQAFVRVWSL